MSNLVDKQDAVLTSAIYYRTCGAVSSICSCGTYAKHL